MRPLRASVFVAAAVFTACSIFVDTSGLSSGVADGGVGGAVEGGGGGGEGGANGEAGGPGVDTDAGPLPPPTSWTRVANNGATHPDRRRCARMVYDSKRQRLVLFGGATENGQYDDTWEWDGSAWTKSAIVGSSPPWRMGFGFAYDSNRNVVTLFGGHVGPVQLWELSNGMNWTRRESAVGSNIPTRLASFNMAYDPIRRVYIGFGGHDDDRARDETFRWDGVGQMQMSKPDPSPPGVRGQGMVFDAFRERIVMFGGLRAADGGYSEEMWLYTGEGRWQREQAAESDNTGPGRRAPACMAYDRARRLLVVFGGKRTGVQGMDDTWLWDGTKWMRGPDGPASRRTAACAYDEARQAVVMFGGNINDNRDGGDDTWILR